MPSDPGPGSKRLFFYLGAVAHWGVTMGSRPRFFERPAPLKLGGAGLGDPDYSASPVYGWCANDGAGFADP